MSDFHVVSWISSFCSFCRSRIFTWSLFLCYIYGTSGSFCNLLKTLPDLPPSHVCVAADNYLRCARLRERYCHASHVWPRLCESASSCSAICPRPGSLIREESCGKVCVSLPDVPLSLQLFVRVGPQQQHRGARDHCIAAGVWSVHGHCGGGNGGKLEAIQETSDTDTRLMRIAVLWFYTMAVTFELLHIENVSFIIKY